MSDLFIERWGITPETFSYVVLPILIFIARLGDVTLSTIRILFLMNGNRTVAPILGFFEAFIWLLAIGQIISDVNNVWAYLAYAFGFAVGTFVGMYIEEKLAVGRVVLRLIAREIDEGLIKFLEENKFSYSLLDGMGKYGSVNVVFLVIKKDRLDRLIDGINLHHPNAFYTIEGVRQVRDSDEITSQGSRRGFYNRWRQIKRR
ncbi:MAG TPA: DUF5698 domain-containing protein [Flavobacteriaceae bacterium]|nr:DUF5698 domain-containing protein [Flavobacteriaceae bacterium]